MSTNTVSAKEKLRAKIKGQKLGRLSKDTQMNILNKECKKAGVDPQQILNMAKTTKK